MDGEQQSIKSDQSVVIIRESNHFLNILIKIIKINRGFALAPFVTKTDNQKKRYLAISPTYTIISYLIIIPVHLSIAYLTAHMIRAHYNRYRVYYGYGRLFLTALTNISCVRNRYIILEAINRVAALGVNISNKWGFMQILMCITVVVMTAVGKYQQGMFLLEGIVAALYNILPTSVFIGICVQYGCQVVAVRLAIEKLNANIADIVHDDGHVEDVILRPIIKKYRDIHKVCSVLNEAYGSPMFFVTSNIFFEATFCIFFLFTTLEYMAIGGKVYIYVWIFFHTLPSLGLLYVCQLTENLSKVTTVLCNELNCMGRDPQNGSNFLEKVELHLLYQHQPIRFDACGFFCLNGTQVQTVISTIITYAVILLQNTKSG